jgi:N-acetylmuramoyl-L-alanine amidase
MCLGLLVAGLAMAGPVAAAETLPRRTIAGITCVSLDDWARARRFRVEWVTPQKELKLASTWSTLRFTVNSRRMALNGVEVWLSAPIALQGTTAWMAVLDLETTLHPVLFPARQAAGRRIKTIMLDPGHGGRDPGNQEGARQEKRYALLFAKELRAALTRTGFNVGLTRSFDSSLDLASRPDLARRRGADLFLSLHFNSADTARGATVQGTEVYCLTPAGATSTNVRGEGDTRACPGNRHDAKNLLLAYQIQKALVTRVGCADRGVRRARWAVLRTAAMPAALIEGGFMTHPTESQRIYDPAYRKKLADAIVAGIQAYRKLVESP